jgi:mRNA interferase MazF
VVTVAAVRRGEVWMVNLDPTVGREIRKARPCVIVSPDELNAHLSTFMVAPLTTGAHPYPFRVACTVQDKHGHVVLDQLRTVDRVRLTHRMAVLPSETLQRVLGVLGVLQEMFAR